MLITFEGIEGSGKTTQISHLIHYLEQNGYDSLVTREPGGTRIGKEIRTTLLDPENGNLDAMAELLLYMADRAQHMREIIKPSLAAGKIVICDRFMDATVVYQGRARSLDLERIHLLNTWVLQGVRPEVTLLLDLSPKIGLARAWSQVDSGQRSTQETRFEQEAIEFHCKVRAGYLELAKCEPSRFRIIDAANSEERVRQDILKALPL